MAEGHRLHRTAERGGLGAIVPVPADIGTEDVLFLEVHASSGWRQADGVKRTASRGRRRAHLAVLVDPLDDVDRPAFDLEEQAAEIFADDAERKQLDGA